jgi:hypothetical protein
MIDNCSRVECVNCAHLFLPQEFLQHLTGKSIDGCMEGQEFTMCLEDDVSAIDGPHGRSPSEMTRLGRPHS